MTMSTLDNQSPNSGFKARLDIRYHSCKAQQWHRHNYILVPLGVAATKYRVTIGYHFISETTAFVFSAVHRFTQHKYVTSVEESTTTVQLPRPTNTSTGMLAIDK